jgi:hypothetical protein
MKSCPEKREGIPEKAEAFAERQEARNVESAVDSIATLGDLCREQYVAEEHSRKPKNLTQENGGFP